MRHSRFQVFFTLLLLLLTAGCKKSDFGSAAPAAAPPTAPATPPPSFSAAQKIGMFGYAKNNQTNDQQLRDEYGCYTQVQRQSGINPDAPAPSGPSAADVQAAANAPQAKGGRAREAARGAVGGAVVGCIVGDAGKGAAIGAVGGTMRGGRRQRQANEQSQQQSAPSAGAQVQRQYSQAKAAYNQIKKEES